MNEVPTSERAYTRLVSDTDYRWAVADAIHELAILARDGASAADVAERAYALLDANPF